MKPGIYNGIDIDEYHSGPGISKSGLDLIAKSPFHYWAQYLNPNRPAMETKAGQLEGSLAHCAILEPLEFDRRYVIGPQVATKATNIWKDFVKSLPAGVTAIDKKQYTTAWEQHVSVLAIPEISSALSDGIAEQSAYWIDDDTGVLCRCRPDWVHPCINGGVILIDVKTCGDASPDEFARQIYRKNYAKQAAFYSDGYEKASGKPVMAFIFAAVEATYPYAAAACMLGEESLDQGRRDYQSDLEVYARCLREDEWPGYSGVTTVSLPRYAIDKPDDEMEISYDS